MESVFGHHKNTEKWLTSTTYNHQQWYMYTNDLPVDKFYMNREIELQSSN